jgi:hypothetical protein
VPWESWRPHPHPHPREPWRRAETEDYFRFIGFLASFAAAACCFCAALRFLAVALPPRDAISARFALKSLVNPVFFGVEEGIEDMG